MIIYGWNSKNIKQAPLDGFECAHCKEKNSHLAIFAHYAHVFWIPFFPYKKSAVIHCASCQLTTEEAALSEDIKQKVKLLKSSVGIPKYMFAGLVIFVLGIGFLIYNSNRQNNLEKEYIQNPQVGDVYILKDAEETTEYNHYLLKVNDIKGDSLVMAFNSFSYNGIVQELDGRDGFYDLTYSLHKSQIINYDASGELKKVIREYSTAAGFDRVLEYQFSDSTVVE